MIDRLNKYINSVSDRYICHHTTDYWGDSVIIVSIDGKSIVRLYWYDKDEFAYIDFLSVTDAARGYGEGTRILDVVESMAKEIGFISTKLCVLDNEWMHKWYKRRGYEDIELDVDQNEYMWMIKKL